MEDHDVLKDGASPYEHTHAVFLVLQPINISEVSIRQYRACRNRYSNMCNINVCYKSVTKECSIGAINISRENRVLSVRRELTGLDSPVPDVTVTLFHAEQWLHLLNLNADGGPRE